MRTRINNVEAVSAVQRDVRTFHENAASCHNFGLEGNTVAERGKIGYDLEPRYFSRLKNYNVRSTCGFGSQI